MCYFSLDCRAYHIFIYFLIRKGVEALNLVDFRIVFSKIVIEAVVILYWYYFKGVVVYFNKRKIIQFDVVFSDAFFN